MTFCDQGKLCVTRYVQGLSGNATAAAKNLTRVEAALERETSTLRSGLHSVQQISAHLKGQVSEGGVGLKFFYRDGLKGGPQVA